MGLRDFFRRAGGSSSDHASGGHDEHLVTAQEGMAATETYLDEDGIAHPLTDQRKAEMMANLERIARPGSQGLVPGVMPEPVVPVEAKDDEKPAK